MYHANRAAGGAGHRGAGAHRQARTGRGRPAGVSLAGLKSSTPPRTARALKVSLTVRVRAVRLATLASRLTRFLAISRCVASSIEAKPRRAVPLCAGVAEPGVELPEVPPCCDASVECDSACS